MSKPANYNKQEEAKIFERLNKLKKELPDFVDEYLRNYARLSSFRSKLAYAYDLKVFFNYIVNESDIFQGREMYELSTEDLEKISIDEIECFADYITYYENINLDKEYSNSDKGKARKLSAIRSLFRYFYRKGRIKVNPVDFVDMPKIREKNIVRLDAREVANLLDTVESGDNLTNKQKKYHDITKTRDLAIVSLLLGTGIRVSECVGINIQDIDFEENSVKILRKGGDESIVFFGEEVMQSLLDYSNQRKLIMPESGHEHAFFLSIQKKRINVRAIQLLVKKYADVAIKLKNISPHKLRSTYGTSLYKETGDIYLVADVLGHKDINTTKKHYAMMEEDRRRSAAKYIKLRKD